MPRFTTILIAFGLTGAATCAALGAADDSRPVTPAPVQQLDVLFVPPRDAGGDGTSATLPPLPDGGIPSDGRMEPRSAPGGVP